MKKFELFFKDEQTIKMSAAAYPFFFFFLYFYKNHYGFNFLEIIGFWVIALFLTFIFYKILVWLINKIVQKVLNYNGIFKNFFIIILNTIAIISFILILLMMPREN